jgi:transposase InsO family protein
VHPNCLKAIRSDNETEFRNTSFDEFCLEHGIDQQFSAPTRSSTKWSCGTKEPHSS